ncbi:MAG: hypothetical protein H5U02_04990 [Clostridia bacterium]|nr:hypothetical protein [Clostridia bacterium]
MNGHGLVETAAKVRVARRIGAIPDRGGGVLRISGTGKRCQIEYSAGNDSDKGPGIRVFNFNSRWMTGDEETDVILICGSVLAVLVLPAQIAAELASFGEKAGLTVYRCSETTWYINELGTAGNASQYLNRFDLVTGEKYWLAPFIAAPTTQGCAFCGKSHLASLQPIYLLYTRTLNQDFWSRYSLLREISLVERRLEIGPGEEDICGEVCEECAWLSPVERLGRIRARIEVLKRELSALSAYWVGDNEELAEALKTTNKELELLEKLAEIRE